MRSNCTERHPTDRLCFAGAFDARAFWSSCLQSQGACSRLRPVQVRIIRLARSAVSVPDQSSGSADPTGHLPCRAPAKWGSRHESDPALRFEAPCRERLSGFLSENQFVRLLVLTTRLTDKVTEVVKRRISGHFAPAGLSSHFRVVTPSALSHCRSMPTARMTCWWSLSRTGRRAR